MECVFFLSVYQDRTRPNQTKSSQTSRSNNDLSIPRSFAFGHNLTRNVRNAQCIVIPFSLFALAFRLHRWERFHFSRASMCAAIKCVTVATASGHSNTHFGRMATKKINKKKRKMKNVSLGVRVIHRKSLNGHAFNVRSTRRRKINFIKLITNLFKNYVIGVCSRWRWSASCVLLQAAETGRYVYLFLMCIIMLINIVRRPNYTNLVPAHIYCIRICINSASNDMSSAYQPAVIVIMLTYSYLWETRRRDCEWWPHRRPHETSVWMSCIYISLGAQQFSLSLFLFLVFRSPKSCECHVVGKYWVALFHCVIQMDFECIGRRIWRSEQMLSHFKRAQPHSIQPFFISARQREKLMDRLFRIPIHYTAAMIIAWDSSGWQRKASDRMHNTEWDHRLAELCRMKNWNWIPYFIHGYRAWRRLRLIESDRITYL